MQKQVAINLLGGSIKKAADAVGITYKAVHKWPDTLTPRITDRVEAALARSKTSRRGKKNSDSPVENKMFIHSVVSENT
jgi:molybdenum-dependent DNA-binding transcriptional regulator ModE